MNFHELAERMEKNKRVVQDVMLLQGRDAPGDRERAEALMPTDEVTGQNYYGLDISMRGGPWPETTMYVAIGRDAWAQLDKIRATADSVCAVEVSFDPEDFELRHVTDERGTVVQIVPKEKQ